MTLTSSTMHAPVLMKHASNAAPKLTSAALHDQNSEFANILVGRHAMLSSSQVLTSPDARGDAAPAAGEFGALKLFQEPVISAQQSVGYSRQATLPESTHAETNLANSNVAASESGDEAAILALARLLDGDVALVRSFADPVKSGATGKAGTMPGQGSTPAAGSTAQMTQLVGTETAQDIPNVKLAGPNNMEPDVTVQSGARRQASLPNEPRPMTLGLLTEGKDAAVVARISGLGRAEAEELHSRIREELAASRLSTREIRINGRLSRPLQESE